MDFNKNIRSIEEKIGYTFSDKSLLRQAFTRSSFCNETKIKGKSPYQSNEVLEFFGDSILSSAIVTLFVKEFSVRYENGVKTKLEEGDFTVIRSKLSDKSNLSARVRELGLGKYLLMGEGDAKLGISEEPSVLEDLFESIIGAIYIDTGMDLPRVISVVSGMLDIKKVLLSGEKSVPTAMQSYKNQLQEWCADKKRRLPPPVYKTVAEIGPEHKKTYERACYIGDTLYATGKGKNQKLADAQAAEKTLAILKQNDSKADLPDTMSVQRLKEYAKQKKISTPAFRDLGETERSTPSVREYRVACSFAGIEAEGVGLDKANARCAAAQKVLSALFPKMTEGDKSKAGKRNGAPRVKKNAAKTNTKSNKSKQNFTERKNKNGAYS